MLRVTKSLSRSLHFRAGNQRGNINEQQRAAFRLDHALRRPLPAWAHRGTDCRGLAQRLDHVFDEVDDQGIMMTFKLNDGGFANAV